MLGRARFDAIQQVAQDCLVRHVLMQKIVSQVAELKDLDTSVEAMLEAPKKESRNTADIKEEKNVATTITDSPESTTSAKKKTDYDALYPPADMYNPIPLNSMKAAQAKVHRLITARKRRLEVLQKAKHTQLSKNSDA